MAILSRYLFSTVVKAILMVLLVIASLDALSKFIDELGNLSDTYRFQQVLQYVLLTLPSSFYEFMPFATLVGGLIGLGALAATSELVAMRASGVSLFQISRGVLLPVILFIICALALSEWVIPVSEPAADRFRSEALGKSSSTQPVKGLWYKEGNQYVFIARIDDDKELNRLARYQFDDNQRLLTASHISQANYVSPGLWHISNVQKTQFKEDELAISTQASDKWASKLTPTLLNVLLLDPTTLAMTDLYRYARHLDENKTASGKYWLSFWQKLLLPFAMISLVLIAISFVFGPLREVTMGFRIFTGVVVGVVFQMSQSLLGPASLVYGFSPLIAVALPIALCALLGLFLLVRAR